MSKPKWSPAVERGARALLIAEERRLWSSQALRLRWSDLDEVERNDLCRAAAACLRAAYPKRRGK